MKEFIINNFFLIAKLIISIGVVLCVLAISSQRRRIQKTNNNLTGANTDVKDSNITNNTANSSKHSRIIMGLGVTTIVVGIILLVIGVLAVIFVIYILLHLIGLFGSWDR